MKTEFGVLTIKAVLSKIAEFKKIGNDAFLKKYANGRGAKSTWISYQGEFFPSKAIFGAALIPPRLPSTFQTSDTYVFAKQLDLEIVRIGDHAANAKRSAINDLDQSEIGNDSPKYRELMARAFKRDDRVRRAVLKRAAGKCEFKKCVPFTSKKGIPYLESHHVVHLSAQGKDKIDNVIALCASHHREAHFGEKWESLNEEFLKILSKIGS